MGSVAPVGGDGGAGRGLRVDAAAAAGDGGENSFHGADLSAFSRGSMLKYFISALLFIYHYFW